MKGPIISLCSEKSDKGRQSIKPFCFCSVVVHPPLTSWPKYQMSTLNCFFVIHVYVSCISHFPFKYCMSRVVTILFAVAQLDRF